MTKLQTQIGCGLLLAAALPAFSVGEALRLQAPSAQPPGTGGYTGRGAGMATWTGKLEKNETLTISDGTPSTGSLSGAGLPGVPVRIVIDQTNLGISETPNRSNGYHRLVLKSHSKHDKIVIHWTVIGQ